MNSEIKPVSIKTGAQKIAEIEAEFGATTDEEQLLCYKAEAAELRAALEALQAENAELKDRITIMDEASKYHNETIIGISNKLHAENEALKLKKEFIEYAAQDLENQAAAQAKRIEELEGIFKILALRAKSFPSFPIGGHIPEVFFAIGESDPDYLDNLPASKNGD